MAGGIGPEDQLNVVKNSALDGETMINETDWITLPVGENLMDHPNVRLAGKYQWRAELTVLDRGRRPASRRGLLRLLRRVG
jgi:hypothetical protein